MGHTSLSGTQSTTPTRRRHSLAAAGFFFASRTPGRLNCVFQTQHKGTLVHTLKSLPIHGFFVKNNHKLSVSVYI